MQRQRTGEPSTEDLRAAMLHYRTLFEELLDTGEHEQAAGDPAPKTEPVQQQAPPQQSPQQQAAPQQATSVQPQQQRPAPQQAAPPQAGAVGPPAHADDAPTPAYGQPRQDPPRDGHAPRG